MPLFIMSTALFFSYEDTPITSVSSPLVLQFWRLCRFSKIYRTIAFGFSFDACPISLSALALRSFAVPHPFFCRHTKRSRWVVLHDSTRVQYLERGRFVTFFSSFRDAAYWLLLGYAKRARFILLCTILPLDVCPCQLSNIS